MQTTTPSYQDMRRKQERDRGGINGHQESTATILLCPSFAIHTPFPCPDFLLKLA